MGKVFLFRTGEDENVIEENDYKVIQPIHQDLMHHAHEGGRGVTKPEGQHSVLKMPIARAERTLWYVLLSQTDLMVASCQIYF